MKLAFAKLAALAAVLLAIAGPAAAQYDPYRDPANPLYNPNHVARHASMTAPAHVAHHRGGRHGKSAHHGKAGHGKAHHGRHGHTSHSGRHHGHAAPGHHKAHGHARAHHRHHGAAKPVSHHHHHRR